MKNLFLLFLLASLPAGAQTNLTLTNNLSGSVSSPPAQTNGLPYVVQLGEEMRARCIEGRRRICGKILQVLPDGLVVESGYTNLLRDPLTKSWLVPGTVTASPAKNLLESAEPGGVCVGRVFLTGLPKGRGVKPARYDYVIIEGYPAGQYTYTSLGTIHRTVRRFSASLSQAVDIDMQVELRKLAPPPAPAK
jgi:hypothetical protein